MSDKTSIEWTEATWNPIRAYSAGDRWLCRKISEGCENCYASRLNRRFGGREYPSVDGDVRHLQVRLDAKALREPLHWKRPRHVFVCSMTDLFGEWVPEQWIAAVYAVMESAPQHTYQILTKRATHMRQVLTPNFYAGLVRKAGYDVLGSAYKACNPGWPLPNVWLGVTVESNAYAWRAKVLGEIPAAVRFVSAEPLLGPLPSLPLPPIEFHLNAAPVMAVETQEALGAMVQAAVRQFYRPPIDWLIVGGESGGPLERRLLPISDQSLGWVRELRDRAQAAGTAFFFKQWGGATPKAGGRLLDGVTWDQFPTPRLDPARHSVKV